ncbi:MAG: ABC transporter substrate-binding protein [Nocardioidaceae bacterium]
MRTKWTMAAGAGLLALVLAGCGTSSTSSPGTPESSGFQPPNVPMQKSLGKGEGAVNILAWPGYAEDGSNDPKVDWVTPFEKQTGCKATVKYFGTSDEAVSLMRTGDYDVVSASGDATLRLIAAGDVAPFNTKLTPSYADIAPFLKNRSWNSVNGQMYGMPHGWGANLLMYNTKLVKPAPTSWAAVFTDAPKYKGKVTAYDSPIYIADAALFLMNTRPGLGIKNPYALDSKQFAAAVALLKKQRQDIGEYWSDFSKEVSAFKAGSTVVGTTWNFIKNLTAPSTPVKAILPKQGSTAWIDTWMVAAHAKHPNCAYMWANYIASPKVQAEVVQNYGEAPANLKACNYTDKNFCTQYHAADKAFVDRLWYWTTPVKQCVDGRTNVQCVDYAAWTTAWQEIKG